ncbi:hypothetical protein PGB90_001461 [Kerria lacca]
MKIKKRVRKLIQESEYGNRINKEKVDSSSCSPYRSDSSDSSDVESVSGSPSSSPPPLISLQDFQSSSSTAATVVTASVTKSDNRGRCVQLYSSNQSSKKMNSSLPNNFAEVKEQSNNNGNCRNLAASESSSSGIGITVTPSTSANITNANLSDILCKNANPSSIVFTLEQLQREFGIHTTPTTNIPQYITIPLLNSISAANSNPPAAHQTPADLSSRSRK